MSKLFLALASALLLGGCASGGHPRDPFESANRVVANFNEGMDTLLIKPVARTYDSIVPSPVRTGVINFFGNIGDVFIGVNNLLQGKPTAAASDFGRVVVNSTIGLVGLIDVASGLGLEKNEEDFGQTLGRWGVDTGPYLVLPFFGPRDLRDTVGLIVDLKLDPVGNLDHVPTRNSLLALRMTSDRASLLPADKVIMEAAIDKYAYLRDAYLQRRRSLVYDGNAPREDDFEMRVK